MTSEDSGIRQSATGIYQGGKFQERSGISSSGDVPVWHMGGGVRGWLEKHQDDGLVAKGGTSENSGIRQSDTGI